jgi:hypothetical protein
MFYKTTHSAPQVLAGFVASALEILWERTPYCAELPFRKRNNRIARPMYAPEMHANTIATPKRTSSRRATSGNMAKITLIT